MLRPQLRRALRDLRAGMLVDALEHIDQESVGIDVAEQPGSEQALDLPDLLRAKFGPAEEPILPPNRIARSARSRWFVSSGTSGSARKTSSPFCLSRACVALQRTRLAVTFEVRAHRREAGERRPRLAEQKLHQGARGVVDEHQQRAAGPRSSNQSSSSPSIWIGSAFG